jgi:hypothetical protein
MLFVPFLNVASMHQIARNRMPSFKKFSEGRIPGPRRLRFSIREGAGGKKGGKGKLWRGEEGLACRRSIGEEERERE